MSLQTSLAGRVERVAGYVRAQPKYVREAAPGLELSPLAPTPDAAVGEFGTNETILGTDDRTRVSPVNLPPWRFVCALRMTFGSSQYVGTGWLIGPHTVMTAGHCVYMHGRGWAKSIQVIPAMDDGSQPFGSFTITDPAKLRAPQGWVEDSNSDADYGAIILPSDVGTQTGYFAFAVLDDAALTSVDANIAGYPADKGSAQLFFHSRTISSTSPTRVMYDIDTFGGQSGSPVWLQLDTSRGPRRYAVGIHTNGGSSFNSGTRITKAVFDNMVAWRA